MRLVSGESLGKRLVSGSVSTYTHIISHCALIPEARAVISTI